MTWVAVGVGGAALVSGAVGFMGAKKAGAAEERAAQMQIAEDQTMFGEVQALNAPWLQAGTSALKELQAGFQPGGQFTTDFTPGSFQSSPEFAGFKFQSEEGASSAAAAASASGRSGATAAGAIGAQQQQIAATSYQSWYDQAYKQWQDNRKTTIAGLENLSSGGRAAATTESEAALTTGGRISNSIGSIGNAQAATINAQDAAISKTLGTLSSDALSFYGPGAKNPNATPGNPGGAAGPSVFGTPGAESTGPPAPASLGSQVAGIPTPVAPITP